MDDKKKESTQNRKITDDIREYIEKRIELVTITMSEQLAEMIAHSMQKAMGMVLLSLALFYAWFGLGFYIGGLIGMVSVGFFIASLPLFILGFVLYKRRSKKLTDKIQAELIGKVLENFDTERAKNGESESKNE